MIFGSTISAKFEVVAKGSGAPSILYETPWNPLITGSLYENGTTPGRVASVWSRLFWTGEVWICARSI